MIDRELEAKSRLVALARKKAERNGTTLEAKVESWLTSYVNESDGGIDRHMADSTPSYAPAPRALITRAVKSVNKKGSTDRSGGDTRSAAYRRLLGVMSDSSKRTS